MGKKNTIEMLFPTVIERIAEYKKTANEQSLIDALRLANKCSDLEMNANLDGMQMLCNRIDEVLNESCAIEN